MHNKIHHYNVCYKWADSPYRMHTISNRAMFAGETAKDAILSHFPGLNLQPVVGRRNQLADIDSDDFRNKVVLGGFRRCAQ